MNGSGQPESFPTNRYGAGEIFRRMRPVLRRRVWRLLFAAVLMAAVGLAVSVMPLFVKYVIDMIPQARVGPIAVAMGLFLVSQSLRMLFFYIGRTKILRLREDLVYHLRSQGFSHVQHLCLRFHNRFPSGFLYERVFGTSITSIGMFFDLMGTQLPVYLSGFVFSLVFCLSLSVPMTAIILVGAVSYVTAARTLAPRIHEKSKARTEQVMAVTQYIMDKLRGTRTIQAFAMEDRVQADFAARVWTMQLKFIEAEKEGLKLQFITEGLGYAIKAAVIMAGAYAVFHWKMPLGTLVAFIGYQDQLISMIGQLANVYGQFSSARVGFDQLFTVLDTHSTVADAPVRPLPETVRGEIEFRDVTFGYGPTPVVTDMNLRFEAGKTVALVGRSGGGKTTIANLLMRFYDPDRGAILLDGTDIRGFPLRPYRSLFGIVLQDPFLFDETVADNLRYARPDASEKEIWAALEKARAAEFVRAFPRGIGHRVGEGGGQLSGGQRQRLAIARCMLLNPRFLILDEATSALDNESEEIIRTALQELFRGRNVLVIAHRLSTIRRADRILVVEQGRIAEDGTFNELLARGGIFHRLHTIATSSSSHDIRVSDAGFA